MKSTRIISFFFIVVLGVSAGVLQAQEQRIGFFESDFILTKIPEYSGIEQRLELLSQGWEEELSEMDEEIKTLQEDYDAKEILYTQEVRTEKQNEIKQKILQRDTFLAQKFGPQGEYFSRQKELLEPIQRQIFTALRTVAERQGFDYVFDRSGDLAIVYARNEFNLNEAILLELGIELEDDN
ncbi:MAG: OmpH family outer membrane protein [Bacteroidota bacterium]